jgi:hypothetical protein
MDVTYSDRALKWTEGQDLLQGATQRLNEIVGKRFTRDIKAEWDRTKDEKGEDLCTLRLAGWTESATDSFTKADLESPRNLQTRMFRLWDKLLALRLDYMLDRLTEDEK